MLGVGRAWYVVEGGCEGGEEEGAAPRVADNVVTHITRKGLSPICPSLPLPRPPRQADSHPGTVIIALLAAHNGRRGTCQPLDDN